MRKTLNKFLNRVKNKNIYFLHGDMFPYCTFNEINCGIQEPNMVNIAAGLASKGKTVIIYGIAGFVLYKAYEQIKLNIKGYAENFGCIIFVNAGANGCYNAAGRGHLIDDDIQLCSALGLLHYEPKTRRDFIRLIKEKCQQKTGASFIRLGWDNEVWK